MDPLLIAFGFGIGLLIGMTGMGGGSLMTPLLILTFGTAPVTAVGSDIAYAAITKTVGGWRRRDPAVGRGHRARGRGNVDFGLVGTILIGSLFREF